MEAGCSEGPAHRTRRESADFETFLKKVRELAGYTIYLKAGMGTANFSDDSTGVNVHGMIPATWVKVTMMGLNLVVWLDAAAKLG